MFKKLVLTASLLVALPAIAAHGHDDEVKHIPGVFIGGTHADGENDFTWGLEYEYKFASKWGAGFVYENTDKGHDGAGTEVKLASVYYHPIEALRFGIGYGEEEVDAKGHHHSFDETLWRASASYDFHVMEHFSVAPTVAVDHIDGENAIVYGVSFLMPF